MSAPPSLIIAHVDERLQSTLAQLFWASFPQRRLGAAGRDEDGRVIFTSDAPWGVAEKERWQGAIDALLRQPSSAFRGVYAREVNDRRGRRFEIALPVDPSAYQSGALVVGPFDSEGVAQQWAIERIARPWTYDVLSFADGVYLDVFVGDPDATPLPKGSA